MNYPWDLRWQVLCRHGLLPIAPQHHTPLDRQEWPVDLLPTMLEMWARPLSPHASAGTRRRQPRLVTALANHVRQNAQLTWGTTDPTQQDATAWIGNRLVWWKDGIPGQQRVAVVSSRLGRPIEKHRSWFAALRTVCRSLDPHTEILTTADRMTTTRFLKRCSALFDIPLLQFHVGRPTQALSRWFEKCLLDRHSPQVASLRLHAGSFWSASVSPPLDVVFAGRNPLPWHNSVRSANWQPDDVASARVRRTLVSPPEDATPLQDRLVIASSDRTVACHIRSHGNVQTLLERRLREQDAGFSPDVAIVDSDQLILPLISASMKALGAKVLAIEEPALDTSHRETPPGRRIRCPPRTILSHRDVCLADYLTHCTRQQAGPWPDQSEEEYLDELILDRPSAHHSPLNALERIVDQQRLIATGRTIRGGIRVVCFTAVPLDQIPDLRTFRAHRGRWDFDPYGISISRAWLEQHGTHPVEYGDSSLWDRLPAADRPFFQTRFSGKQHQIDWSVEQEWRHIGDIDLTQLGSDAAVIFVSERQEAERLCAISRWPVLVVGSAS